jgi:multimeric flavodoxin WrbA
LPKKPDEPGCPQEDEAVEIFQRMIAADGVLYASPLFCWGYSAQIKPLIDRHFCLVTDYGGPRYKSLLEGKRAGLLVTCAGPEEDNTESIVDMFTRLMDYAKCKPSLTLVVPFCTTPDAMGDNIREMARRFASRFAAISP